MQALKDFTVVTISDRRWFQRSAGNTYHTVAVYVDGHLLGKSPKHYGYGDQYKQTAHEMLQAHGYYPKTDDGMNDYSGFLSDTMDYRNKFVITVSDVSREKDL